MHIAHIAPLSVLLLLATVGCSRPSGQAAPPVRQSSATTAAPASDAAPSAGAHAGSMPVTPGVGRPAVAPVEDLVQAGDTLASLRARHGVEQVVEADLPIGEGDTAPGWLLFPGQPTRELAIHLGADGAPDIVVAGAEVSAWGRRDGVRIGLDTRELDTLNGRPFEFLGFDWDYGGTVSDWKGGRLGGPDMGAGPVTLCPPDAVGEGVNDCPAGDVPVMSDDPRIRRSPAVVCEFGVRLRPAP